MGQFRNEDVKYRHGIRGCGGGKNLKIIFKLGKEKNSRDYENSFQISYEL